MPVLVNPDVLDTGVDDVGYLETVFRGVSAGELQGAFQQCDSTPHVSPERHCLPHSSPAP
jgi:hypothetical protein